MAILGASLGALKAAALIFGVAKPIFISILIAIITYYNYDMVDPEKHPKVTRNLRAEYDFIVVGAGSAGNIVANRLTENPNWNVLLLEAGGHETEITDVPILSLYLHKSKLDWKYRTQPQASACQAMVDKRCCWTRGKVSSLFSYIASIMIITVVINQFFILQYIYISTREVLSESSKVKYRKIKPIGNYNSLKNVFTIIRIRVRWQFLTR